MATAPELVLKVSIDRATAALLAIRAGARMAARRHRHQTSCAAAAGDFQAIERLADEALADPELGEAGVRREQT